MAAKKRTKKRVPVLTFAYDKDVARGDTICVEDMHYTLEYRSPLPKGCFYPDELLAVARCLAKAKRVHFEKPAPSAADTAKPFKEQQDEAEQEAALMLKKLDKDPTSKARKLKSLVKSARFKFKL